MANQRKHNRRPASVWLDTETMQKLRELAEEKQREVGAYPIVTRSDAIRMVLEEHLDTYVKNLRRNNDPRK